MEDLDLVNVTWCQDDSDNGATSTSSDYDYEVTSASDRGEPEAGLLVRWFNIFQHFISVVEMDKEEIWSIENGQDRSTLEGKG